MKMMFRRFDWWVVHCEFLADSLAGIRIGGSPYRASALRQELKNHAGLSAVSGGLMDVFFTVNLSELRI